MGPCNNKYFDRYNIIKTFKNRTSAFTLSEVLITLAIIGVISAISVPTLLQKTNQAELKTAYKEAYSVASQAVQKMEAEGTLPTRAATPYDVINDRLMFNNFKNQLKVIKDCNGQVANCFIKTAEDTANFTHWGAPWNGDLAFIDSAGRVWTLWQEGPTYTYDQIFVDTNGLKDPNKWGKDRFVFSHVTTGGPNIYDDMISTTQTNWANLCPSLPCYYTSWITGKDN